MQWKPIANKYRKGTMKSTLHSTYATVIYYYHAYKLQREWKREWNRLTGNLLHPIRTSHILTAYHMNIFIQRSTIGQSVFAPIHLVVAGCCVHISSHCMPCYDKLLSQDATIRPVLKHGPRSSTGLRVVEFIYHKAPTAKRKQYSAKCNFYCTAAQADCGCA